MQTNYYHTLNYLFRIAQLNSDSDTQFSICIQMHPAISTMDLVLLTIFENHFTHCSIANEFFGSRIEKSNTLKRMDIKRNVIIFELYNTML